MAKKNDSSANPFDAIATTKAPSSKATTKLAASVTDEVKGSVDRLIVAKAQIKAMESEAGQAEAAIIEHVRPQQDKLARSGTFSKSFEVKGNTGSVTYVTSDRFSLPKEEKALTELQELLGDKFNEYFHKVRTITLNSTVQENKEFIQKLLKAVSDAGMNFAEAFTVTDTLKPKEDLDRKQYELSEKELEKFRTLVKQNKPALK